MEGNITASEVSQLRRGRKMISSEKPIISILIASASTASQLECVASRERGGGNRRIARAVTKV